MRFDQSIVTVKQSFIVSQTVISIVSQTIISRLTELVTTMMLVKFISHFMYIIIIIWDILVTISIYNQDLVKNTIDYI